MSRGPTFDETVARVRARVGTRPARHVDVEGFQPAAVLIPVLNRAAGPTVLFTRRTETVALHKGQISFPGGRCEPGEATRAAALREAWEEVALDPATVETSGPLDDHPSVSSYVVTPWVGLVSTPPASFQAQASEVVEPFELPLADLLDRGRFRTESWDVSRMPPGAPVEALLKHRSTFEELEPGTQNYKVYFFDGGPGHEVWGLTARVLKDLLDFAFDFSGAPA